MIEQKGYKCIDIAYHHNLPDSECRKINKTDTPVSILYRTMPDFLVTDKDVGFYVELKIGNNPNNAYFEAFPLMANQVRETSLGIPCVYIYAGVITDFIPVAIGCTNISPEQLIIPKRNKKIKNKLCKYFTCPVKERETRQGTSGDAFVIVPASDIKKWRTLEDFL